MSVLFQLIYRFNAISMKIQVRFLVDIETFILQFIRKNKIIRTILKKNKNDAVTLFDFNTYYII